MSKRDVRHLGHMILWVSAKNALVDGDSRVYLVPDKSGMGNHLVQSAPDHAPLKIENALNGKAIMNFDGLSRILHLLGSSSLIDPSKQHMIYIVSRSSENHDGVLITNVDQQGTIVRYKIDGANSQIRAAIPIADANDCNPQGFSVITVSQECTNSSAGVIRLAQNGSEEAVSSSDLQPSGDTPFAVGRQYDAENNSLIGDIAEILIFDVLHNSAEKQIVEDYLMNKYNL